MQLPWPGCLHTTECPDSTADASQYLVLTESLEHRELSPMSSVCFLAADKCVVPDANVFSMGHDSLLFRSFQN